MAGHNKNNIYLKKSLFYPRAIRFLPIIITIVILIMLPLYASSYIVFVAAIALLYAMVAAGYDVLLGYTGQLSFCQGAFYGIGAYLSAILTVNYGWSFWQAMPISVLFVGLVSAIIGYPALRLRGAYFAVTTFFLAHFVYLIFLNEVSLTGGPLGFRGIRPPEPIGPLSFESMANGYLLILFSFIIIYALLRKFVNSNVGLILKSIEQDDILAESMGINTAAYKLLSFVISAIVAGYAGTMFAHFFRLLHPTTFSWFLSEMVVIITLVGGVGTLIGPVLGAGIVTFILEFLRFAPEIRYVGWAIALIAILMFEPKGLMGLIKRIGVR
jgi:branched-chain amino acid transport system permease protein